MFSMARGMTAVVLVALVAPRPALAEQAAAKGVKLVCGFEIKEMLPKDDSHQSYKVGRAWTGGGTESGWRFKDHEDELTLPPDHDGDVSIYWCRPSASRDGPIRTLVRTGATQGRYAWKCMWTQGRYGWPYKLAQTKAKWPGNYPPREPMYGVYDHFFQRECQLWKKAFPKTADWSGYERFRFDVTVVGAPLKLGVRVREATGPRLRCGPTGLRTALGLFTVPADKTVTCDFPLAEMARVGELDLTKVSRYHIRLNGFPANKAPKELYIDNIRLVAADAEPKPTYPLIAMENAVRPFIRPVHVKPPTVRNPEKLKRELGPVEPLGPVVINQAALYAGRLGHGSGHFGRSGATYMSNSRRACVAYDNKRLLVLIGGTSTTKGPRGRRRGGTIVLASFDGGKTWGGLTPEDQDFTSLPWYLRSNFSADQYGNVYAIGTPNCDSYNEGQDVCIHRLAFTGETWVDDRFAILHQDGYKCPNNCYAMALPNGRIWAAWGDGWSRKGLARYSDDDGFTWLPCKDASVAKMPRPFYEPKLEDLGKADAPTPPKGVLLWPTQPVPGPWLVPYKGHVAAFTAGGGAWAFHDGIKWSAPLEGPKIGRLLTVTVLGDDHIFLCRGAGYNDLDKEVFGDLVVADLRGDKWHTETLETDKTITSAIVTASGEAVFCFYVKKIGPSTRQGEGVGGGEGRVSGAREGRPLTLTLSPQGRGNRDAQPGAAVPHYEVRYRRWKGGTWEPSVKVATENRRINHLAAPQICPPDYAAIFWDQHFRKRGDPSEVKFVRVPSR